MARVSFPDGAVLDYVLESTPATVKPSAHFSDGALTVRLPESDVRDWASTEQVSIEAEEILDKGDHLKILIEKDFVCLVSRECEDESDMYPHPLAAMYPHPLAARNQEK
jgi:hypothetical protein